MTAAGVGEQGYQAVGLAFESLTSRIFYDLSQTFFDARN